ncbi:hypothetical protein [Hymenobacter metallilatus]|uniref:Uncharacterized protein n=1 Tax=Hymenobacter metallilatus TaxID=2493666 RepID=A0A3R9ML53_9BACT|nr:hypothetical protein [Hymenobacter metallilatus]RSK24210.1 hypothetical protein EI290_20740 [Hymenobacter metallilatus]
MSTMENAMRLLRQSIRELEREAQQARENATKLYVSPEQAAQYQEQARDAEKLIAKKEQEIEALRNSVQLDLFRPKP